jgi:hypothetical protein
MDAIKGGNLNGKSLREQFPLENAKFPRFISAYIQDNLPKPEIPQHPLRPWQAVLDNHLNLSTNYREIIFVVDPTGNKGKTWYAKWYTDMHENSQLLLSGRKQDMAFALRQDIRVLFINCPRKSTEYLQFEFMEHVKDGTVFNTKYESFMKRMPACHVVVMMNQAPDMEAFSADRYHIFDI